MFLASGAEYFNPDEAASRIRSVNPGLSEAEVSGEDQGEAASPPRDHSALSAELDVRIWYAGLNSIELHIARVTARVEKGGHAIPEQTPQPYPAHAAAAVNTAGRHARKR